MQDGNSRTMRVAPKAGRKALSVVAFREDRDLSVQKRGKQAQVSNARNPAGQQHALYM
jgi:hypothetical protein